MAVLTHEVHDKVRIEHDKPYGCHNHQDRSEGYLGSTWGTAKFIEFRMSKECRYDMSLTDPRCENCKHRGSGEEYNEMVRSKGT